MMESEFARVWLGTHFVLRAIFCTAFSNTKPIWRIPPDQLAVTMRHTSQWTVTAALTMLSNQIQSFAVPVIQRPTHGNNVVSVSFNIRR
jgi:hypothetical protein